MENNKSSWEPKLKNYPHFDAPVSKQKAKELWEAEKTKVINLESKLRTLQDSHDRMTTKLVQAKFQRL